MIFCSVYILRSDTLDFSFSVYNAETYKAIGPMVMKELPVVRETALKNLVNALFDAAKDSNGNVNLEELISLFDEARKASLEEDVLINPLKTESFEAVSAMIKTAASQLEDSFRDQVLEVVCSF